MATKQNTNRFAVFAFVVFSLALFALALDYGTDRSLQRAEIIVLPFFGSVSQSQTDPWAIHFEDFFKYGNPFYYWEKISN